MCTWSETRSRLNVVGNEYYVATTDPEDMERVES